MDPYYNDYEDMEAESRLFPSLDCEFEDETTEDDIQGDEDFYDCYDE
jgi:hypothetical protein